MFFLRISFYFYIMLIFVINDYILERRLDYVSLRDDYKFYFKISFYFYYLFKAYLRIYF